MIDWLIDWFFIIKKKMEKVWGIKYAIKMKILWNEKMESKCLLPDSRCTIKATVVFGLKMRTRRMAAWTRDWSFAIAAMMNLTNECSMSSLLYHPTWRIWLLLFCSLGNDYKPRIP